VSPAPLHDAPDLAAPLSIKFNDATPLREGLHEGSVAAIRHFQPLKRWQAQQLQQAARAVIVTQNVPQMLYSTTLCGSHW
jgi:hypothetical protein